MESKPWYSKVFRQEVRFWIYNVTTAGLVLAPAYGYMASKDVPLWIAFIGAITGMASINSNK